jgi:hypothetical protein
MEAVERLLLPEPLLARTMEDEMVHRILMWDWRQQADVNDLNEALKAVFDGEHCPSIIEVQDTGGDDYAVIITAQPITEEKAQEIWEKEV